MDPPSPSASPRKRVKTEHRDQASHDIMNNENSIHNSEAASKFSGPGHLKAREAIQQACKESQVGILQFVNSQNIGYTDFLVNEILLDGTVSHLTTFEIPRQAPEDGDKQTEPEQEEVSAKPDTIATEILGQPSRDQVDLDQATEAGVHKIEGVEPSKNLNTTADGNKHDRISKDKQDSVEDQARSAGASVDTHSSSLEWRQYAEQQEKSFMLSPDDRSALESFLGSKVTEETLNLFNKVVDSPHRRPAHYGAVKSENAIDRGSRTAIHQMIRRVFSSRLDSFTDSDGFFIITAPSAPNLRSNARTSKGNVQARSKRDGKQKSHRPSQSLRESFAQLGGQYLHFTLYKENKDTMEVVSFLGSQLKVNPKAFQFAGTKDRRAVTVQRVSAYRTFAQELAGLNRRLRGAKIGNFAYEKNGLVLGELQGNEFVITLRECQFPGSEGMTMNLKVAHANTLVEAAINDLSENGFLNYYGLQRFGTFSLTTDVVGTNLLRGDYEAAVSSILHVDADVLKAANDPLDSDKTYSSDDKARALGIDLFLKTGQSGPALSKIPRKFSAESNLVRFLGGKSGKGQYLGAIQAIPRTLRLMYIHAYQSLVWNHAVNHRWMLASNSLLVGDLVLVREHREKGHTNFTQEEEVDEDGEPIIRPAAGDRAITEDERFERARPLTQEEIDSGKFNVYDVVLPTPGYDIIYPSYMVAFYEELMGRDEFGRLDPHNMRRTVRDFSLSGSYRKMLARPLARPQFNVISYADTNEQFVETDLQRIERANQLTNKDAADHKGLQAAEVSRGPLLDQTMSLDGAAESKISSAANALLGALVGHDSAHEPSALVSGVSGTDPTPEKNEAVSSTGDPLATGQLDGSGAEHDKLAVTLTLQLGSSTYATMALRELTKGGVSAYKTDNGVGR